MANNQAQLIMDKINSTDDSKQLQLIEKFFFKSFPNFNDRVLATTQKKIKTLVVHVISRNDCSQMTNYICGFPHNDLIILDMNLYYREFSGFLAQDKVILIDFDESELSIESDVDEIIRRFLVTEFPNGYLLVAAYRQEVKIIRLWIFHRQSRLSWFDLSDGQDVACMEFNFSVIIILFLYVNKENLALGSAQYAKNSIVWLGLNLLLICIVPLRQVSILMIIYRSNFDRQRNILPIRNDIKDVSSQQFFMDQFDKSIILVNFDYRFIINQLFQLKILRSNDILIKFNQRKALLNSDHVIIEINLKDITNQTIFLRIFYLLIFLRSTTATNNEELYIIVLVYAHAPLSVTFHLDQVTRFVFIDDGVKQVGVQLAEIALFFQFVAIHEDHFLCYEMGLVYKDVQLKRIDFLIVSEIPDSDGAIHGCGVEKVLVILRDKDRETIILMSFQLIHILFREIKIINLDDPRLIRNHHDLIIIRNGIIQSQILSP